MDNNNQSSNGYTQSGNDEVNITRLKNASRVDLQDSPADVEKMQPETVIIDLPEVADIPGQEKIRVPNILEMQDVTISSAGEEGAGIFDDNDEDDTQDTLMDEEEADDDDELVPGNEADVSAEEAIMLERTDQDMPTEDDINLRRAELDNTDNDGDLLNEGSSDVSGADLDISGSDDDDPMEDIGEEDEENNHYSLGSDSNDNLDEGTP